MIKPVLIILISLLVFIGLFLIIFLIVYFCTRKKRKSDTKSSDKSKTKTQEPDYFIPKRRKYDFPSSTPINRDDDFWDRDYNSGSYFESRLYRKLYSIPEPKKLLRNCYVPLPNGYPVEIDTILITRVGIFVFEAKARHGFISGAAYDEKWKQELGDDNNEFENPILQNDKHITALADFLGEDENIFYSVIVFDNNNCHLDIDQTAEDYLVLKLDEVVQEITEIITNNREKLDEDYINLYYNKLYRCAEGQVPNSVIQEHDRYVSSK